MITVSQGLHRVFFLKSTILAVFKSCSRSISAEKNDSILQIHFFKFISPMTV